MDFNMNFQDNIPSFSFNSTSENILNWVEENRDKFDWAKDPNAYEMVNLFLFGAKHSQEGEDINLDTLAKLWEIRSKDFEGCNISQNHFVYALCEDSYQAAASGRALVNDEKSHHALRKMAGIGLYLKQQQRDREQVSYNNPQELLTLLDASMALKTFHPDLFEKYAFGKNLDTLCRLQLSHNLSPKLSDEIQTAQKHVSEGLENINSNNKSTDEQSTDAR